jgi:outer membrane protein OmpA-like peptidoglycan-associated protein
VGLSDDVSAIWWNPAGLGQLKKSGASFSHQAWFAGIHDEYASVVFAQRYAVLGVSATYSGVGEIPGWNEQNQEADEGSQNSLILGFTYAAKMHERFTMGFTTKFLYDKVVETTGKGMVFDLAGHCRPLDNLGLGVVLQNIGPKISYESKTYDVPTNGRVGLAWRPIKYVQLVSDLEANVPDRYCVHLGSEFWVSDVLALRAGFRSGPQERELDRWSTGFGLKVKGFTMDYAFIPYGDLGNTHRLFLASEFGSISKKIQPGRLIVKVVDASTNAPLDAQLEMTGVKVAVATTDAKTGTKEFGGMPSGIVTIRASRGHYNPSSRSAQVVEGKTTECLIALSNLPPGEITGTVYDAETKQPVPGVVAYSGQQEGKVEISVDRGRYQITGLQAGSYSLKVLPKPTNYFSQGCDLQVKSGETVYRDFPLLREKLAIILKGVNFETGKAILKPESYKPLDEAGKILIQNPQVIVEVAGHTDPRPIRTPEFPSNLVLSQARAEVVRQYLINKFSLDPRRLLAKGYGDTQPIAPNDTKEGMAKNRRTEFRILGELGK